ncbi:MULTISPECIES: pyruvate kinase [unclassified Sporosarcina]|uniref:pyruvate kinase n=1 Tax=unclassified Sporosarcina TaxID=2647733 RepID=UPI000C166CF8|nr:MULTISPECIES: pyruvate kinase [unclassified Sporosarcina]PID03966.1 pyruvate kinase [Sporosarcina sp. P2]PID24959.1 pyruvate kinase [Sporosarcina sp. P7]
MRKTKIVCTIGPASESYEGLLKLIDAGMNVARLNFSHGTQEEHRVRIERIRKAAAEKEKMVGILLDTKGPEIRTHKMKDGQIELVRGQAVDISMQEVLGTAETFSVTYEKLIHDVERGSFVLLDDGLIELEVTGKDTEKGLIHTKVINAGPLKDNKGVNVPNVSVQLPGITDKDKEDILFGIEQGVDFIAASFVRRASDVIQIRELLENNNGGHIHIVPKIENQEGVDNLDAILQLSDGLMVARGDLGVEIPAEEVPLVQKMMIRKCNQYGKPVITATQMLDSMQRNPRPTRAEASDVANAILDGSDAVMLSGETAAGLYPVESVKVMCKIALSTEESMDFHSVVSTRTREKEGNLTEAIGQAASYTALNLNVKAILAPTESGQTATMIAKYRPGVPIIAVTRSEVVSNKLTLVWGVYPIVGKKALDIDGILQESVEESVKHQYVTHGDVVIITAGVPVGEAGTTNLMKLHVIGDLIGRGQGIGKNVAFGKAKIIKNSQEALTQIKEGDIIVTHSTDRDMFAALERCAGIITETGGLTSHAAVVGLSLGIPVIVGVENITSVIKNGSDITMDAASGVIYNGHAKVL